MAAVTITWDPTSPAGGDALSAGDDSIRTFKTGLKERLTNGGHCWDATSGPTVTVTDGRHSAGASNTAGSAELAGEFNIYAADKTTQIAVFRDSTALTPSELYLVANKLRTTGTVQGATITPTTTFVASANNTVDIGSTGTRFKDLWLAGNATIAGTTALVGVATFTAQPVFSGGITVATQLYINGGQRSAISINASGPVTITTANRINLFSVISGSYTANLPTAAGSNTGVEFYLTITAPSAGSANTVTVDPSGAELINGVATLNLRRQSAGDRYSMHIVSDGTNWQLISDMIA